MNCDEAIGWLVSHAKSPIPDPLARHLETCESCRRFADALREIPGELVVAPRAELIKSLLLRDLRPVTPLVSELVLFVLLLLILSAVLIIGSGFFGVHGWSSLAPYSRVVIFGALLFGVCLLALAVVRQMAPGSGNVVSLIAGAAVAVSVLLATVSHAFHWRQEPRFVEAGLHCLTVGLIYAALSALLCWLVLRRGAMLSHAAAGAMGGGLAGLVGLSGLEILCPNPNLAHILLWHLSVPVFGVLGGWIFGAFAKSLHH